MTRNEFAAICARAGIEPAIALECDEVVAAIKTGNSYPECMRADAIALVEDTIAGQF